MLKLKPNCECCDRDLPPGAAEVRICSYECTFCTDCVERVLSNVCPNCGGGFVPRPIRPARAWRPGVSRSHHKPSSERAKLKWTRAEVAAFVDQVKGVPPEER